MTQTEKEAMIIYYGKMWRRQYPAFNLLAKRFRLALDELDPIARIKNTTSQPKHLKPLNK